MSLTLSFSCPQQYETVRLLTGVEGAAGEGGVLAKHPERRRTARRLQEGPACGHHAGHLGSRRLCGGLGAATCVAIGATATRCLLPLLQELVYFTFLWVRNDWGTELIKKIIQHVGINPGTPRPVSHSSLEHSPRRDSKSPAAGASRPRISRGARLACRAPRDARARGGGRPRHRHRGQPGRPGFRGRASRGRSRAPCPASPRTTQEPTRDVASVPYPRGRSGQDVAAVQSEAWAEALGSAAAGEGWRGACPTSPAPPCRAGRRLLMLLEYLNYHFFSFYLGYSRQ